MSDESEYSFRLGTDMNSDTVPMVRHCDDEAVWTVECYDDKLAKKMEKFGAIKKLSIGGHLYIVDSKQLIIFMAEASGIHIEFKNQKKRTLSDDAKNRRSERMKKLNVEKLSQKTP
jgi:hypothetical protein